MPRPWCLKSRGSATGSWNSRSPKGATRRIYVDFSQPIAGSAPGGANPTAPPSAMYKFRALAQCSIYGNSLLDFAAGEQKTCPLRIGFTYNGSQWALVMNPYASVNGPFPETNYATVTCIFPATGSSPCSQWKFTPSGTYRREWLGELPERGTAPRDHHRRRTDCRDRSRRLPPVVFDPFGEVNTARITGRTRLASGTRSADLERSTGPEIAPTDVARSASRDENSSRRIHEIPRPREPLEIRVPV